MPARIKAPHEASAPLYPDLPPHLGAFRSPAKVHTKLRQNAYKIADVVLLSILHQQLTTLPPGSICIFSCPAALYLPIHRSRPPKPGTIAYQRRPNAVPSTSGRG